MPTASTALGGLYRPPQLTAQFSLRHSLAVLTVLAVLAALCAPLLRQLTGVQAALLILGFLLMAVGYFGQLTMQCVGYRRSLQLAGPPLGSLGCKFHWFHRPAVYAVLALLSFVIAFGPGLSSNGNAFLLVLQSICAGVNLASAIGTYRLGGQLLVCENGVVWYDGFFPWSDVVVDDATDPPAVLLKRRYLRLAVHPTEDDGLLHFARSRIVQDLVEIPT